MPFIQSNGTKRYLCQERNSTTVSLFRYHVPALLKENSTGLVVSGFMYLLNWTHHVCHYRRNIPLPVTVGPADDGHNVILLYRI